jgi:16S rRNA processing protein RimM
MGDNMEYIQIGKIVSTHGIKGEVKAFSDSDFKKERFKCGNTLYLSNDNGYIPIIINSYREHKNMVLITFNNFKNINDVLKYIGFNICIKKDDLPILEKGHYYLDIIGLDVYDMHNKYIGIIKDIRVVPQGGILEIKKTDGKISLVPYVDEFVIEIDVKNKKMIINPIEGLL